mgnify:FL=1
MGDTVKLYIDGRWVGDDSNGKIAVINPATGQLLYAVYSAHKENLRDAVKSAERAFKTWSIMPGQQRARILEQTAERLIERRDAIAIALTTEQGKPIGEAKGEVEAAIQSFKWAARQATASILTVPIITSNKPA